MKKKWLLIFFFSFLLSSCEKKISLAKLQDPLSPEEHFQLGLIYYQAGEWEPAEQEFKKTLKKAPEDYLAWFYLGLAFHQQKKYQKAVPAYKKSLSLNPNYAPAFNNLADAYLNLDQLTLAEKTIKKALELGGENQAYFYLTYAQILFKKQEQEKACEQLEKSRAEKNLPEAEKLWQENCR